MLLAQFKKYNIMLLEDTTLELYNTAHGLAPYSIQPLSIYYLSIHLLLSPDINAYTLTLFLAVSRIRITVFTIQVLTVQRAKNFPKIQKSWKMCKTFKSQNRQKQIRENNGPKSVDQQFSTQCTVELPESVETNALSYTPPVTFLI